MLYDLLAEFTPYRLLINAISTGIITVLARGLMWLFKIHPSKEWAYWIIGFLFVFSVIITMGQVANPPKREERPQLLLAIEDITVVDAPKEGTSIGVVLLVANVRNRGEAASTAEGFKLTVRMPNGNTFVGNRQTIPEKASVPFPGGQKMWISGEDSLDRKTAAPIQRGAHVRGRLLYWFENLHVSDFRTKGTAVILAITDNWGRESTSTLPLEGLSSAPQILDYPGMRTQSELQGTAAIPEKK